MLRERRKWANGIGESSEVSIKVMGPYIMFVHIRTSPK